MFCLKNGLVQVYTGNSKGKTTAALGLAMRALGHGFSVAFVQFLKGGNYYGEFKIAKKFPKLKFVQFGVGCTKTEIKGCHECKECFEKNLKNKQTAIKGLEEAYGMAISGKYDLLVLDEINFAVSSDLLSVEQVINLIKNKHPKTELILTGRNAPKEFIEFAQLVTEMREIKHPMKIGLVGREGIDY